MGYAVSYLAVRTPVPDAVYSVLDVEPTGEREEIPESPLLAARLADGWTLIFCNRLDHRFVREAALEQLSREGEVVACEVDEHEGISKAAGWRNGSEVWSIVAGPDSDGDGVRKRGRLPGAFAPVFERLQLQQHEDPETNYLFEIPVECVRSLTGFRYDFDVPGGGAEPYEVLVERGLGGSPIPGLSMQVEVEPPVDSPSLEHIGTAVDRLTPRGGPSFLILEGRGEDFAQTAGGDGIYTVEWREYSGTSFRHWVAGTPGETRPGEVAVRTNGFRVTVRRNERLSADDVKAILTAYAQGTGRPERFVWRDVSTRFA